MHGTANLYTRLCGARDAAWPGGAATGTAGEIAFGRRIINRRNSGCAGGAVGEFSGGGSEGRRGGDWRGAGAKGEMERLARASGSDGLDRFLREGEIGREETIA